MRWIAPPPLSAAEAVARVHDELDRLTPDAEATLLWWPPVSRPALVLGRSAASNEAIRARAEATGLDVARRPSGGGPVLWDADLIAFDILLPRGHPLAVDDVVASYEWLGELVADALRSLGLPARRLSPVEARAGQAEIGDDPTSEVCFGGLSPHEVVVDRAKVLGLCQARRAGGTLLQAGVPTAADCTTLTGLLGLGPEAADRLAGRVGTVPVEAREAISSRLAAVVGERTESSLHRSVIRGRVSRRGPPRSLK